MRAFMRANFSHDKTFLNKYFPRVTLAFCSQAFPGNSSATRAARRTATPIRAPFPLAASLPQDGPTQAGHGSLFPFNRAAGAAEDLRPRCGGGSRLCKSVFPDVQVRTTAMLPSLRGVPSCLPAATSVPGGGIAFERQTPFGRACQSGGEYFRGKGRGVAAPPPQGKWSLPPSSPCSPSALSSLPRIRRLFA